jgi:DNA-binding LacI/PurR family transcriptional regulator
LAITLRDIAERCGVAVSTVSNILNNNASSFASDQTKQKVRQAARDLGYRKDYLSVSLRTRRTRSIGLCVDRVADETRRFFITPFVSAFNQAGYEVALTEHLFEPALLLDKVDSFTERCKDAVVVFTDLLAEGVEWKEPLADSARSAIPHILAIGSEMKGLLPSLDIERGAAFHDVMQRFAAAGVRRLLVVYKRAEEFRDFFKILSGAADNPYGLSFKLLEGIYSAADFINAFDGNLENPDFDGIFFRTDEVAIPVLSWLQRSGSSLARRLPVIGFDNFRFSQYTEPALTTYDINFEELGKRAFEVLHHWLDGAPAPGPDYYQTIEPAYIERESHNIENSRSAT